MVICGKNIDPILTYEVCTIYKKGKQNIIVSCNLCINNRNVISDIHEHLINNICTIITARDFLRGGSSIYHINTPKFTLRSIP